jgi:hypothetical protein
MDFYTKQGGDVGPLPVSMHDHRAGDRLNQYYNQRFQSGR